MVGSIDRSSRVISPQASSRASRSEIDVAKAEASTEYAYGMKKSADLLAGLEGTSLEDPRLPRLHPGDLVVATPCSSSQTHASIAVLPAPITA